MKRVLLLSAGYAAVGLGFAGALLPLLPTTPFLLVALFCFSKSSPKMKLWMTTNRYFGSYLKNYQAGEGVPPKVKAGTILTMWSMILFSALLFVDSMMIRAGLFVMAMVVSIHILQIGSKKRTLILFPTETEAEPFRGLELKGVWIVQSGVGMVATISTLERVFKRRNIKMILLAGIAGAYEGSDLKNGETVLVQKESTADMGTFRGGEFEAKFTRTLESGSLPASLPFRRVRSHTVNGAGAPFIRLPEAEIENMEGAAFFAACLEHRIPFLEIRTISNQVGDLPEKWEIPLATHNLAQALKNTLDAINA